ncbi:MAG TPA: DUF5666 domain-containing protein [Chloroflexota bacterium]|jgi:hypothetical protein
MPRRPTLARLPWLLAPFGAALALALGATPALGQDADQFVFGPVVELSGNQATVATQTGPVVVALAPDTSYEQDTGGTLADVQPGEVVGVTGRPDNNTLTAVEIHVFPTLMTVRQAQTPMSGANAGNLMTNARVESLTDDVLTLNLADQLIPIRVTPATTVTHPAPVDASQVQQDTRIGASGPVGADGVLDARVVWISGTR